MANAASYRRLSASRKQAKTARKSVATQRSTAGAVTISPEVETASVVDDHRALAALRGISSGAGLPAAQTALGQMQRTLGNQHVLRLLEMSGQAPVQRQPSGGGAARLQSDRFASSAKLELCFENKDRLHQNDSDSDATRRVQQALLDVTAITGNKYTVGRADGIYGPATAAAVRKFKSDENLGSTQFGDVGPGTMHRLDQLFSGSQPPSPKPPGPGPSPQPQPTPVKDPNPELEDTMDAIWLQYQMMLKQQNDALNRLEKDLSAKEEPKDFKKDVLEFTVKTAIGAVLGPIGDAITDFVKARLKDGNMSDDDQKKVVDNAVKPVLDKATDAAKSAVSDKATEQDTSGAPKLDQFIETQRGALDEGSDKGQETFLTVTKPKLREVPKTKPPQPGKVPNSDPRVDAAKAHLEGVRKEKFSAGEKEYDDTVQAWALTQAQSKLKTQNRDIGFGETAAVTDMSNAQDDTPGVISLEIQGGKPADPVKLKGAKVNGLSEIVRKRLNRQNPTLLGLGLPILASGKVSPGLLGLFADKIKIAQNEPTPPPPDVFELTDDKDGKNWLRERAAARQGLFGKDIIAKVDPKTGAESVFDEDVNNKTLSQIPDQLQGP